MCLLRWRDASSKIANTAKCFSVTSVPPRRFVNTIVTLGRCCVLKKGRKDVLRSLRLTEETSRGLSDEAERQSVSFSSLVNTVLTKYLEYGRYAERYGELSFSHSTIIAILDALSDETVAKLGRERGKNRPKDMLASIGFNSSLANTVQLVEKYLSEHARWFNCTLKEDQDGFLIHLSHHLNRKWSIYLGQYVSSMFREFGFKPAEVTVNEHTLILRLVRTS